MLPTGVSFRLDHARSLFGHVVAKHRFPVVLGSMQPSEVATSDNFPGRIASRRRRRQQTAGVQRMLNNICVCSVRESNDSGEQVGWSEVRVNGAGLGGWSRLGCLQRCNASQMQAALGRAGGHGPP